MAFFDPKGDTLDATAYAYAESDWALLQIVNLNARRDKRMFQEEHDRINFKAFVKSFKDNFNPGWVEVQYPNQSVPLAFQSMPKRSIQIEWSVPSTSAEEAIKNLQKCSWLASSMYPTLKKNAQNANYTPKSSFMAIKFANLIQNLDGGPLPGYISSFSYAPNLTEGIHIVSSNQVPQSLRKFFVQKKKRYLFPNLVDISIEFKPIQARDSFGLSTDNEQKTGWLDSSFPYGFQTDTKRDPDSEDESTKKALENDSTQLAKESQVLK